MRKILLSGAACLVLASFAHADDLVIETTGSEAASVEAEVLVQTEFKQHKAADLMDARVVDAKGDNVGPVADLLVDDEGGARFVLVDVGYIFGLGEKLVAMPTGDMSTHYTPGGQLVIVDAMSVAELEAMPAFDLGQYDYRLYSEVRADVEGLEEEDAETTGDAS